MKFWLSSFFLLLFSSTVFSQSLKFEKDWWQPNNYCVSIVEDTTNNRLFLAGPFDVVGPTAPFGSILDSGTGFPLSNGDAPNDFVLASASDGKGGWFIGGRFTKVGDSIRNHLAHLDQQGKVTAWNPNANHQVYALEYTGYSVYVGGRFTQIGGLARNRIAELDTINGSVTMWNPNSNDSVLSILSKGNRVYVGGVFTRIGDSARSYIAALDKFSGKAIGWDPYVRDSLQPDSANPWLSHGFVKDMAISGDLLIAGGDFDTVGNQAIRNLVAIDTASGIPVPWYPSPDKSVLALQVEGSNLFVGGAFSTLSGQSRNGMASFNLSSLNLLNWNPDVIGGSVHDMVIKADQIIIGGGFTSIAGQVRMRMGSIDTASGAVGSFSPASGHIVKALGYDGNSIFAGGHFTTIGGVARKYLASLNISTKQATSWNPQVDGEVLAMVGYSDTIIIGGRFYNATPFHWMGKIHATNGSISTWNPFINGSAKIRALHIEDTILYVGGNGIVAINGVPVDGLGAMNVHTGVAYSWAPPADTWATSITSDDDHVYAGTQSSISHVKAFDKKTGNLVWTHFADGKVRSLDVHGDRLFAAGDFRNVNWQWRVGIVRFDKFNGTIDNWTPALPNFSVDYMSVDIKDNKIYVGGRRNFTFHNPARRFAAYDIDSANLLPWDPMLMGNHPNFNHSGHSNFNKYYSGITEATDSRVYMSGNFNEIEGEPKFYLAVFNDTCPTSQSTQNVYACNSYSWINGKTYTSETTTAYHIVPGSSGCDSIIFLNLSMLPDTFPDNVTSCSPYTWQDGNVYTQSTSNPTITYQSQLGCDSVIRLNLTIIPVDTGVGLFFNGPNPYLASSAFPATYQWLDCDNGGIPIPSAIHKTFYPTQTGNYAVIVTQNGCSDTSNCHYISLNTLTGGSLNTGVQVFPNPSEGQFWIEFEKEPNQITIQILSVTGQIVYSNEFFWRKKVEIQFEGEAGIYLLKIKDPERENYYYRVIRN